MDEKARAARNAYKREWNRQHPDRVKRYQDNYWSRKAAEAEAAENKQAEARK